MTGARRNNSIGAPTFVDPINLVISTSAMILHSGDHMASVKDSFIK